MILTWLFLIYKKILAQIVVVNHYMLYFCFKNLRNFVLCFTQCSKNSAFNESFKYFDVLNNLFYLLFLSLGNSKINGYMFQNSIKMCCNSNSNETILWKTSQSNMTIKNSIFLKLSKPQKSTSCIKFVDLPYFGNCVNFLCLTKNSEFNFVTNKSLLGYIQSKLVKIFIKQFRLFGIFFWQVLLFFYYKLFFW